VRRTGPTNILVRKLITDLKKASRLNNAGVWRSVAEILEKPSRNRPAVNLSKIERYSREGEMIIVPGKVLASGKLTKKVTIAAIAFSEQALRKIKSIGARAITIEEAMRINPSGSNTRIIV